MTDRQSSMVAAVTMAAMFAVGVAFGIALDHRVFHRRPSPETFIAERRAGGGPFLMAGGMPGHGRRPPGPNEPRPDGPRPGPERALDQFARELDLTAAQRTVADSILRHEFEAVNDIRAATWPQMQSVMDDTRRKLDSVLSPAQRERYRAMLADQERRFRPPRGAEPRPFPSHER